MKYCNNCKAEIRNRGNRCPLCRNTLTGEDEAVFPERINVYKQHRILFKMLILVSIAAIIICFSVNIMTSGSGAWSLFVFAGVICFWISLALAVKKRDNVPKSITYQAIVMSILCVAWDAFTGWRGWSLDYVLPIASSIAMASMMIIAAVKKMPVGDYIVCFVSDAVFGILPLIFYFTLPQSTAIPSIICIAFSIFSISAIIIFEWKNIKLEVIRRLHI